MVAAKDAESVKCRGHDNFVLLVNTIEKRFDTAVATGLSSVTFLAEHGSDLLNVAYKRFSVSDNTFGIHTTIDRLNQFEQGRILTNCARFGTDVTQVNLLAFKLAYGVGICLGFLHLKLLDILFDDIVESLLCDSLLGHCDVAL
jgi:hypothetical protein